MAAPKNTAGVDLQPIDPEKETPNMVAQTNEKPKRGRKKKAESSPADSTTSLKSARAAKRIKSDNEATEKPTGQLAVMCETIGENIRYNRKLRKFSIGDLAGYLELSSSYVGLLERGERCPSLKTLLRISELYGVSFSDLLAKQTEIGGKPGVISEPRKSTRDNKLKSITSLLSKLSEYELDFVINVLKAMKTLDGGTSNHDTEISRY